MEESKRFYLSQAELLQDLTPEEMDQVERLGQLETVPQGKLLYSPGERGSFFILKRGRVQVYRLSPLGRRIVLMDLVGGSCFGEISLFRMQEAFAETIEKSLVCIFSLQAMEALMERFPRVTRRLLGLLGKRLAEAEQRLEELAFKSVPARLVNLLLRLPRTPEGEVIGFSQSELAEIIGSYRETVNQVLEDFELRGLVRVGRLRIKLLNEAGLKRVALR